MVFFCDERRWISKTKKQRGCRPLPEEDWRGTAAGITSGHLSSFTNTSTMLSTMRGEYSTPGLGVFGSILYQFISMYFII
jgi:hypothetical protein